MKRLLICGTGVALAFALVLMIGTRLPGVFVAQRAAYVYTVAQLRADMGRRPALWRGRAAFVQAMAYPLGTNCPPSTPWCTNVVLTDDASIGATTPTLVVMAAPPDPYTGLLRRVPLLGRLIPDPQRVAWGQRATYRVYVSAQTFTPCLAPCLNVQLKGIAG